jgi:hypothetical protein
VITELFQDVDRLEWLRLCASEQSFDLWRLDEKAVQGKLKVGQPAEYDMLVLHGYCKSSYGQRGKKGIKKVSIRYAQYFDKRSFVLRIMNFMTSPPNSLSFFSLSALNTSLALASRPRTI